MKVQDIILIGLAAVGIYYIGKRFINDGKKPIAAVSPSESSVNPNTDQVVAEAPPASITMVGTPNVSGDLDVLKWVENQ